MQPQTLRRRSRRGRPPGNSVPHPRRLRYTASQWPRAGSCVRITNGHFTTHFKAGGTALALILASEKAPPGGCKIEHVQQLTQPCSGDWLLQLPRIMEWPPMLRMLLHVTHDGSTH